MAYKFEDKFVHFRWDDSLKGKKVFYADSISTLEEDVAKGEDIMTLIGAANKHDTSPFCIEDEDGTTTDWKFIYYDPNYEVKLAFEKGMVIQYKAKDTGNWCDWDNSLCKCSFHEDIEYRVKPEEDDNEKVLKWTDLKVGDVITNGETTAMVVVSDSKSYPHLFIGYRWVADVELKNWKKVKND